MSFDPEDWPPPCRVRRSKRAKRVSLRVGDAEGLELVLPQRAPKPDVYALLERHRPWVLRQLGRRSARLAARGALHGAGPFAPPAGFWLHGGELRVDLDIAPGLRVAATRAAFAATPAAGAVIWPLAEGDDAALVRRLAAHIKAYARLYLAGRLEEVSARYGLFAKKLCFGTQKSRWGSYAPDGLLRLNHKLVFLPAPLADHVILHELCHGAHPNHSPAFWSLLQNLDAAARKKNKDLAQATIWIPDWFN